MDYDEIKCDLFEKASHYFLVHCASSDTKMGMGIAKEFVKRYGLSFTKSKSWPVGKVVPDGNVITLITKEKYYGKPTYGTLTAALLDLRSYCEENNITMIAMPKIGCGLDKLDWQKVRKIIKEVFKDMNIEVLVCYQ